MTTFQELIDDVLSHQFSPARYTPFVKRRLNESQALIAAQVNFRNLKKTEDFQLVHGESSVALPTDFQRQDVALMAAPGAALFTSLNSLEEPNEIDLREQSLGSPVDYAIEGGTVRLWPAPDGDAVLRLKYYRLPATLDAANDVPDLPDQYLYLMVERTLQLCYARENDYSAAQYHQGQFDIGLARAANEAQADTNDRSQPRVVSGF